MKNNHIDKEEYGVSYPNKEKAFAFITPDGVPFLSATVGVTYPTSDYAITRNDNTDINLFEYIAEGEGEVLVDGKWKKASAGDVYILRAKSSHKYRASTINPWHKLWVNYVADYMPAFLDAYGIKNGVYQAGDDVKRCFEELTELSAADIPSDDIAYKISDRLHKIIRIISAEQKNASFDEAGMRKLLGTYVYKKFDLGEFAALLHMSKVNAIRQFKKVYGKPPYEYLIDLKLDTAKVLLRDTSLPVKEIADKLCIIDEHYFSTLFLRKIGLRPTAYRKG